MDIQQEPRDDEQSMEENHYIWLAAFLLGGILILMLLVIAGIILWKYFKKPNTADQNWAGPSPLAEGNNHDNGNFHMNECILGNMQLSSITPNPIPPNEPQNSKDGDLGENTTERKPTGTAPSNILSIQQTMPMSQFSNEYLPENDSNEETFPPPPPLVFPTPLTCDDFPLPDLEDYPLQPLPPSLIPSDEDDTLLTFSKQGDPISKININTNTFDDQLLPPPPPPDCF